MNNRIAFGVIAAVIWGGAATAQTSPKKTVDEVLAGMGVQSTRGIDTDICYPATAAEYEALGKNAILMLKSTSALSTELPLRSVYLVHRAVRIPLHRVAITTKEEGEGGRAAQYSFYLLPVHYMKADTRVVADFTGNRSGFGVASFTAKERDDSMPAFVRLDEYDQPEEPDMQKVAAVLLREYPDQAPSIEGAAF